MICNNCGTQVPDNSTFCLKCGARISDSNIQPVNTLPPSYSSSVPAKKKKNNGCLLLVCIPIFLFILILALAFIPYEDANDSKSVTTKVTTTVIEKQIAQGDVFEPGNYIMADGLKIKYDGNYSFTVINKSDKIQMLSCGIYGVKKDGTYEFLGVPAFYGIDKEQYDKDKEENGWAVEHTTNRLSPKQSLTMKMEIYDFGDVPFDVDNDGYYDVRFTVSEQSSETGVQVSTDDYQTECYKLKAK